MRWFGLLVAVACTGDGDKSSETGNPTDSSPEDTTPEVVIETTASLSARVVDASETPVANASIRFCRGPACKTADSDTDGRFSFTKVEVDWHSLEVVPPSTQPGLATAFVPIVFGSKEARGIEITLPPLDAATTLGATTATAQIGDGLQIEIAQGDLKPPTFVKEATEVAGVRLTTKQWVPVDGEEGTVVAQWFLSPFDHHANVDIPMTFANDYLLADGAQLRVIVGDYLGSEWLEAGTLTVTKGEITGTANLPVTSTVVLLDVTK